MAHKCAQRLVQVDLALLPNTHKDLQAPTICFLKALTAVVLEDITNSKPSVSPAPAATGQVESAHRHGVVEDVDGVLVVAPDAEVGVALHVSARRVEVPAHQLQQRALACRRPEHA